MVVTPPHAAAAVPDSKSSAVLTPATSTSRCVCTSTPPGSTRRPEATISSRPGGSACAIATTCPARTPMSAVKLSVAVTTVPPRTTRSWLMSVAPPVYHAWPRPGRRVPRAECRSEPDLHASPASDRSARGHEALHADGIREGVPVERAEGGVAGVGRVVDATPELQVLDR